MMRKRRRLTPVSRSYPPSGARKTIIEAMRIAASRRHTREIGALGAVLRSLVKSELSGQGGFDAVR